MRIEFREQYSPDNNKQTTVFRAAVYGTSGHEDGEMFELEISKRAPLDLLNVSETSFEDFIQAQVESALARDPARRSAYLSRRDFLIAANRHGIDVSRFMHELT